MSCSNCACQKEHYVPPQEGKGKVALVLDSPTEQEDKAQQWLVGKRGGASELLRTMVDNYIEPDDLYITSALHCRPNPKKKAMQKKAMLACRERLIDELLLAGVEKVLCVGPIGYGALMELEALPAITKVRGRWERKNGINILATLPPGFSISDSGYFRDMARDIEKFFFTDEAEPEPDVSLWEPQTPEEVNAAFEFIAKYDYVSCDLETEGFSPRANDIICCGLGVLEDPETATVVVLNEWMLQDRRTWRRLEKLINGPQDVVFHNAKFDLQFFITFLNLFGLKYDPHNIHDTMMLHYALDERPMGKYKCHSLENIARVRYDAPDYGIDMQRFVKEWAQAPDELREKMRKGLHKYMALDVYYTGRLFPDLWNQCLDEDEKLIDLYEKLFMPGTIALATVENHGILLDQEMFRKSSKDLDAKAEIRLRKIREYTENPDFNPGSPPQVKKLIYEDLGLTIEAGKEAVIEQLEQVSGRKEGIRSRGTYTDPQRLKTSATAAPVLKMIARGAPEHQELIDDICEWRNLTKNAGTYIKGLLSRVDVDGRIHGTLNVHGTASGRLSSTDPNLQNMPPASHTGIAVRSGFMAPEGYSLIDADYKQLEVRIAAENSGDPAMKELFEKGGDPHAETSYIIYGKHEVSHYERMLGKILTFGLLYGRSPNSIATGPEAEDITARGGKRWAPADVQEFFGNLLGNWSVYAKWRQRCREAPYRDGEITFSIGRKRRFDFIPKHDGGHAGRQGINTPCQGTASDFCFYALIRLHERLKNYDAQVISTVHDSLLIECRDDQLDEVIPIVEDVMQNDTLWPTKVPLAVDLKVCKRWGEDDDAQYAGTSIDQEELAEV